MRGGSVLNGEGPQVDARLVVGLLDGDLQRMQIAQRVLGAECVDQSIADMQRQHLGGGVGSGE